MGTIFFLLPLKPLPPPRPHRNLYTLLLLQVGLTELDLYTHGGSPYRYYCLMINPPFVGFIIAPYQVSHIIISPPTSISRHDLNIQICQVRI